MRLTTASNKAIRYACMHFHYAKSVPVNTLGYNIYNDNDEWCGVILFGTGANNYIGNEYNLGQGQVFELVRVALNGKQAYTSQCVSASLKQLKKDCPLCRLVVSYADCDQEHLGTIYQATNWIYVGTMMQNKHDSSWIIHGHRTHGRNISDMIKRRGGLQGLDRQQFINKYIDKNATKYITKGKRKYLMPLDKQMRKICEAKRKPYPKTDAQWHKIDRSIYHQRTKEN